MMHVKNQNLDSRSQGELLSLVRKLAFCEPYELQGLKIVVRFSKPLLRGHYYRKTSAQAPDFRYEEYVKLVIILNFVRKSGNCLLEPVDMLEMMKA